MDQWLRAVLAAVLTILGCFWLWQGQWLEGGAALVVALLIVIDKGPDNTPNGGH